MSEEEYTDEEYEEEEVEEEIVESAPPSPSKPKAPPEEKKEEKIEEEIKEEEKPITPLDKEPHEVEDKEDEKEEREIQELHPQLRKTEQKPKEPEEKELTEAEIAMMEARKRHEAEEEAKMVGYEERRKQEMAQLDQELNQLKEQHRQQRKKRVEEEKARKEAERHKRQMMMAGSFIGGGTGEKGVRNFVIEKRGEGEKLGPKSEGGARRKGPSAAEAAEAKRNYMAIVNRPVDVDKMLPNDIKNKIKQLHARIVKLEGEKYDLEKRKGRQEYDLKELSERQKQAARQKALNTGVDPTEVEDSNFPPKVRVASKFDRKTDRREYGERREMFENPAAPPEPEIAHGSGRPPTEWGRKEFEELEQIRKNLEPPKYMEQVVAEGDAARPPVPVIPLQIPGNWNPEDEKSKKKKRAPAPPPKARA
uniref:Troponin T n=1 Tax=Meloidogyne floridensis TaxID=298350 RepID=A0A915NZJ7_9BILA